jgi:hypothetical protein
MIHSFKVLTTLPAYRIVNAVTGTAYTVKCSDTQTAMPIGVTKDTVKDTTGAIPVACVGERAKVYFGDTCASGELVQAMTDGSGMGKRWTVGAPTTTALTITAAYVGVLLGPTVALTGTIAEILVMPGLAKGV